MRRRTSGTTNILFVCSGNTCRSPIAAGLARARAAQHGMAVEVTSCGTLGIVGSTASAHGRTVMAELGIDIADHVSQGVRLELLERADYVFVRAPKHEDHLLNVAPSVAARLVRTREWAGPGLTQIDDPLGREMKAYRACRDALSGALEHWFGAFEGPSADQRSAPGNPR